MRSRRRLLSDDTSPLTQPSSSKYATLSSTSPVARAYRLHNLKAKADVVMDKDNRVSATGLKSDERGKNSNSKFNMASALSLPKFPQALTLHPVELPFPPFHYFLVSWRNFDNQPIESWQLDFGSCFIP